MQSYSSVRDFYKSKNVFITGATGFLGSFVIEKILRTFQDIGKIYILIRSKNGHNAEDRKKEYFKNNLFDRMKIENPNYSNKIVFIEGNLSKIYLGLSQDNIKLLKNTINVVFHIGANISLDYPLYSMINDNLKSTKEILELSKHMKNIECFIFVSSIFSYGRESTKIIKEKIYQHPIDPHYLINMHDNYNDKEVNARTSEFIMDWPNTYTYVKNATENICLSYQQYFPIGIFRPGIIVASYHEPIPFYDKNGSGLIQAIKNIQQNIIKTMWVKPNVYAHAIPVDLTANALLAIAYVIGKFSCRGEEIPIYNYTSANNKISLMDVFTLALKHTSFDISSIFFSSENLFTFNTIINQYIPALLAVSEEKLAENKKKHIKNFKSVSKFVNSCSYFTTHNFETTNDNTELLLGKLSMEDKKLIPFDVSVIDWQDYFEEYGKINYDKIKKYNLKKIMNNINSKY